MNAPRIPAGVAATRIGSGSGSERRGLSGHLRLVCASDAARGTYVREQSFSAPAHISKPHWDSGALIVNVANPTAGLLAGDQLSMLVTVEPGARLLLSTPSASRVHRGRARVEQQFVLGRGSALDHFPDLFIPHAGAEFHQQTRIFLARESELLFFEQIAPGRVAHGEAFAYEKLEWKTDLFLDGTLLARERFRIEPGNGHLDALRARFPTAYYASALVFSPRLQQSASCWQRIHDLHQPDLWTGCTPLHQGGWSIKAIAAHSVALRAAVSSIRKELYLALGRAEPELRRVGGLGL